MVVRPPPILLPCNTGTRPVTSRQGRTESLQFLLLYLWSSTRAPVFIDLRRGSQPLRNEHNRFFGAVQPEFRSTVTRTQKFS